MSDALERALVGGAGRRNTLRIVRVKITATSPLTVQLPDGTAVRALAVVGLTYTVDGYGSALVAEGIIPVVLPTA